MSVSSVRALLYDVGMGWGLGEVQVLLEIHHHYHSVTKQHNNLAMLNAETTDHETRYTGQNRIIP